MAERLAPPLVVVAAGGTGGHLFPAEALAVALTAAARGRSCPPTSAATATAQISRPRDPCHSERDLSPARPLRWPARAAGSAAG